MYIIINIIIYYTQDPSQGFLTLTLESLAWNTPA